MKKMSSPRKVEELLEPLRDAIRDGLTDREVAKRTSLSPRTIARWRARNHYRRLPGALPRAPHAVAVFGESLGDVKQRTAKSAVQGSWEPPVFLTRENINYTAFLRLLDAGARIAGMSSADLVAALGISATGVEQGLQILAARATVACKMCGDRTPFVLEYCSVMCRRLHMERK